MEDFFQKKLMMLFDDMNIIYIYMENINIIYIYIYIILTYLKKGFFLATLIPKKNSHGKMIPS